MNTRQWLGIFGALLLLGLGSCWYKTSWYGPSIFPETMVTVKVEDPQTGEPLSGYFFYSVHTYPFFYEYNPEYAHRGKKIGSDGQLKFPYEKFRMVKGEIFTKGHEKIGFSHKWSNTENGWKCERNVWYQLEEREDRDNIPCKMSFTLTPRDVTGDSEAWHSMLADVAGMISQNTISGENNLSKSKKFWKKMNKFFMRNYKKYEDKYGNPEYDLTNLFNNLQESILKLQLPVSSELSRLNTTVFAKASKIQKYEYSSESNQLAILDSGLRNDPYGHGTYIAKLIKAIHPSVNLYPIKVLNENGEATAKTASDAIREAINQEVEIIYLGAGSFRQSERLHNIIERANKNDITIIAPAGNYSTNQKFYPAAYDEVTAVSSFNQQNKISGNHGSWIDYFAPGYNLIEGRTFKHGTSGSAAIFTAMFSKYSPDQMKNGDQFFNWIRKHEFIHRNLKEVSQKNNNEIYLKTTKKLVAQWKQETHQDIADKALDPNLEILDRELYKEIVSDDPKFVQFKNQILKGAAREDCWPRYLNHFSHGESGDRLSPLDSTSQAGAQIAQLFTDKEETPVNFTCPEKGPELSTYGPEDNTEY